MLLAISDLTVAENLSTDTAKLNSDVALGQRMYRNGIRPNGEPMAAVVTGDVAVLGTQFSCQSCHGRSGMGTAEGAIIIPPIAAPVLFSPHPQPKRPAYDLNSLTRALRDGVSPTGRPLDSLMPRFVLLDSEVEALAAYLMTLSNDVQPGVSNKKIRLATVISADVDPGVRVAVLAVLNKFVDEKNRQTRLEGQRPDRGSGPAIRMSPVYRELVLDVWELQGAIETWPQQLDEQFKRQPVFALLGGLINDRWQPVGKFCERKEIPCLFPSTNLPDAEEKNFYSLHFSRGLYLETELIANQLLKQSVPMIVQVYCRKDAGIASQAMQDLISSQEVQVEKIHFDCGDRPPIDMLLSLLNDNPEASVILWLGEDKLKIVAKALPPSRQIYLSSTILGKDLLSPLEFVSDQTLLVHPFRLPGKIDSAFLRFKVWAKVRGIDILYPKLQSEAFFACLAVNDAISHIDRFLVQDYLLDTLDHAQSMMAYLPIYPRPTLGPGQRFLTKGGYILPMVDGLPQISEAVWLLP